MYSKPPVRQPPIPPRPTTVHSPSKTKSTTTTATTILGGLFNRFPSPSPESTSHASPDTDSPRLIRKTMHPTKVYSSPRHLNRKDSDLDDQFGLLNVSQESEALAKGRRSPFMKQANMKRTYYTLKDFDLGVTLGTGSFGRVKFATFCDPLPHEENTKIALKMLKKQLIRKQNQIEHIQNEKMILATLSSCSEDTSSIWDEDSQQGQPWLPLSGSHHPFIVRLFGTFQTSTYLFMVQEFISGGEFFTHLRTRGHFKNHEAIFYCASVSSVFAFLHAKCIAYRDLKPENLLLDHQGYLKMVDFGFAKILPDNKTYTLCGTPEYIAPEVLMNAGHGRGVDWWALGVLTYEMLSGVSPFADSETLNIYKKIVRGLSAYPSYFDPAARSFTRRLIQVDVKRRYGCLANEAEDVLKHRWLENVDMAQLLLRKLPPPFVPATKGGSDTSCFEAYPFNPEDNALGEWPYEQTQEDAVFGSFDEVV